MQLLELWPLGKFHAQIWQVWKWARISETAARRAKITLISTPWGRQRVHVQLLELWPLAKFHAQIWQFRKLARILETAAHRAKISSISIPWGRMRIYVCNGCGCETTLNLVKTVETFIKHLMKLQLTRQLLAVTAHEIQCWKMIPRYLQSENYTNSTTTLYVYNQWCYSKRMSPPSIYSVYIK